MKRFILARHGFGPSPNFSMALRPFLNGAAILTPLPGLILTFFESESESSEITDALKETGAHFFLFPYDPTSFSISQKVCNDFESKCQSTSGINSTNTPQNVPLSIDIILDKVAETGIESLTPEEKAFLEANS